MQQGLIIKALAGFYYVQDGPVVRMCRARGILKKKGMAPLVGDRVKMTPIGNKEGIIDEILPRRVALPRPPIANVDEVILVFSVKEPDLNLWLLDRMIVQAERAHLPAAILFSKMDLLENREDLERLAHVYRQMGYTVLLVSSRTGEGVASLRQHIQGKISVLAGQSGVGKSSILNALAPHLQLKAAEISQKLGRGRHTTRHVELLCLAEQTFVADTPGFSQLDFGEMEVEELAPCFRDFHILQASCQYRGCLHEREEGCAVRKAAERGEIAPWRYEHYLDFMQELKENKERRY